MNKLTITVLTLVLATFALVSTGCKSAEEKACENLIEILKKELPEGMEMPEEMADVDKCVADMKKNAGDCKDIDAALECMAEASSAEDLDECESKCE